MSKNILQKIGKRIAVPAALLALGASRIFALNAPLPQNVTINSFEDSGKKYSVCLNGAITSDKESIRLDNKGFFLDSNKDGKKEAAEPYMPGSFSKSADSAILSAQLKSGEKVVGYFSETLDSGAKRIVYVLDSGRFVSNGYVFGFEGYWDANNNGKRDANEPLMYQGFNEEAKSQFRKISQMAIDDRNAKIDVDKANKNLAYAQSNLTDAQKQLSAKQAEYNSLKSSYDAEVRKNKDNSSQITALNQQISNATSNLASETAKYNQAVQDLANAQKVLSSNETKASGLEQKMEQATQNLSNKGLEAAVSPKTQPEQNLNTEVQSPDVNQAQSNIPAKPVNYPALFSGEYPDASKIVQLTSEGKGVQSPPYWNEVSNSEYPKALPVIPQEPEPYTPVWSMTIGAGTNAGFDSYSGSFGFSVNPFADLKELGFGVRANVSHSNDRQETAPVSVTYDDLVFGFPITMSGAVTDTNNWQIGGSLELQYGPVFAGAGIDYSSYLRQVSEKISTGDTVLKSNESSTPKNKIGWHAYGGFQIPITQNFALGASAGYNSESGVNFGLESKITFNPYNP